MAIGYVKVRHNRIDIDPDLRVREAIALVFTKFAEFQSIRQVHFWLRHERIVLPAVRYTVDEGRSLVWKLPVYNTVHHILTNPIYAGAYAFGRTGSRVASPTAANALCVATGEIDRLGGLDHRSS